MAETTKKVLEIEIDVDSGDVKTLNKDVKGVAKSTEKAKKGVSGLAGGFKRVGTAMKAAGIGLVVALLAKLADSLGQNQKAADFFSTSMTALSLAFNDFFGFISDNLGTVTDYFKAIFDDPQQAVKDFAEELKVGLINRFKQFMETLSFAGKALAQFFEGDFAGAWETAKKAAVEAVDIIAGEENGLESITNAVNRTIDSISEYTKSTIESAQAITEQTKTMQFSELASRRLQLQFQKAAEDQRQIRDDETKSFEERIAANERLGEILQEAAEAEQAEIQKRIDFTIRQNELLGVTQERLLEIEALRIEQLDVEERIGGIQSEQLVNRNSLLREQADYQKSIIDEIAEAEAKAAKEKADQIEQRAKDEKAAADATVAVANATIGSLSALNQAFSKEDEKGRREAFKREKALGIASAVINTAKSAVSAYNSMAGIPFVGPVLAPIAAVAAIAAGAAQIKNITKQKYKGESGGGGGGGASGLTASGGGSAPSAPQFNTVGTSGFNQINESLNNNNRNPTKAYVVSGEVSSAQSLDRNRIKEATFP